MKVKVHINSTKLSVCPMGRSIVAHTENLFPEAKSKVLRTDYRAECLSGLCKVLAVIPVEK